jgi:3-oxo-5-alpha-steroid 4-dehydrogenase 1
MTPPEIFTALLLAWTALAPVVALLLTRINAPYGRHGGTGAGPRVPARLGWFLMEVPALVTFPVLALALSPGGVPGPVLALLLGLWVLHYGNRALVYPWRLKGGSPLPVVILASGAVFNAINGTLLSLGFTVFGALPADWAAAGPAPGAGAALFLAGLGLNWHADAVLRALRRAGPGYAIPRGGAYRWVSCPNYLGEMLEWAGFALASWSLPGLAFALWTAANLMPRALAHHRWYRRTFPDYPPGRRAVLPFVL